MELLPKARDLAEGERERDPEDEILALIEAFRSDDFGAALDGFEEGKLELIRQRMTSVGEHTNTVLSLLNHNQRTLLAEVIENALTASRPKAAYSVRPDKKRLMLDKLPDSVSDPILKRVLGA